MSDVNKPSKAVEQMRTRNAVIAALLGGTEAMRAKGRTYMPQWPLEDDAAYRERLNVSTLYPALLETLANMVGRVFYRDMNRLDIPQEVDTQDIDALGNKLEIFCSAWFSDALAYGVSYCVVDYQRGAQTLADAKAQGLRPYAVHVQNGQVLGFRNEIVGGREVCTQFRYAESATLPDGEFGEKHVVQIVVLEPGVRRVYREKGGQFALHEEVPLMVGGKPLAEVPVVALYTERTGFFTGRSPLQELAWLNIKHWQSQSDQDNITHWARVPLLARFGITDSADIKIGASTIDMPPESDIRYIEHSGAAIAAGAASLAKLEEDMATAGAKLLTKSVNTYTDSQARDEQAREVSALKAYANRLEDAIGQMLWLFALWLGLEDGGSVEISGNLDIDYNPAVTMQMLRDMYADGIISAETVFREAQKRDLINPALDWETEQTKIGAGGYDAG